MITIVLLLDMQSNIVEGVMGRGGDTDMDCNVVLLLGDNMRKNCHHFAREFIKSIDRIFYSVRSL